MSGLSAKADLAAVGGRTIDASYRVVDDFLPGDLALLMRSDIEAHFRAANPKNSEVQQIWNYKFTPGIHSYLQTTPGRIIPQKGVRNFVEALKGWSAAALGLRTISWPVLSFYLAGCGQGRHDETGSGRFAYVYSLTSNTRQTRGGRTLVFDDGESPSAAVEPVFNRLILYDVRAPHAVEQLAGTMDPLDGRFELRGYISESPPVVVGALSPQEALSEVGAVVNDVFSAVPDFMSRFHGPLCLRIDIEEAGSVQAVRVLLHRVLSAAEDDFDSVLGVLRHAIESKSFPKAAGKTMIILPIMLGGFLPSLGAKA